MSGARAGTRAHVRTTARSQGAPAVGSELTTSLLLVSALLVPVLAVVGGLVALVYRSASLPTSTALHFFPGADVRPEPGEQRAYVVALLMPLLLAATFVLLRPRRSWLHHPRAVEFMLPGAAMGQALLVALGAVSLRRQEGIRPYFRHRDLAVAACVAAAVAVCLASPAALSAVRRVMSRLRPRRRSVVPTYAAFVLAVVLTAAFVSTTVYADKNIAAAPQATWYHLTFVSEEFAAFLGGATPLVDFTPQYTSLLPYLVAPIFWLTGFSVGSFTTVMAALTGMALLSAYVAVRHVTRGPVTSLVLYGIFLAMTFYPSARVGSEVHTVATYYAEMPLRYLFTLLLTGAVALLAVRSHQWGWGVLLGVLAGGGLLNNVEFGLPAVGAVVVAVFVAQSARGVAERWSAVAAAEVRVLLGMCLAVALYCAVVAARSGHLPDVGQLLYFSRQFAASGFFMLPMPGPFGLHLVMYLSCALGLAHALCRCLTGTTAGRDGSRLGLLAYTAVFALGAGTYYVGRTHPSVLIAIFCAWTLCMVVLASEVLSWLAPVLAGPVAVRRLLAVPLAALAGLVALAATSALADDFLGQQPGRIASRTAVPSFAATDMHRFVADCTAPGDDVMMIYPTGHRIADRERVRDHFPYNHPGSVVTMEQLEDVVAALRSGQVEAVFTEPLRGEVEQALAAAGFATVLQRPTQGPAAEAPVTGAGPMSLWRPVGAAAGCS
ncbi:MAG: hypothetical protein JWN57_2165 [Frankiales bacterium]|nr:hypothetical protein [Frankiales bacterium]